MNRLALLVVVGGLLLAGCGESDKTSYVSPGSSWNFTRAVYFYVTSLPTGKAAAIAADPSAQREQEIKDLVEGSDTYASLTSEATAALILNGTWSAPAGITISNQHITVSPAPIVWKTSFLATDTWHTVQGQQLVFTFSLSVAADASPVRGKVEVTLPNFSMLEQQGLYLLEVPPDRPAYVADPELFSLGDWEIKKDAATQEAVSVDPSEVASVVASLRASLAAGDTVTYKLSGSATGADITYTDGAGQGPHKASDRAVPLTRTSDGFPGMQFAATHGAHVSFSAQNTGPTGSLTCSIEFNGTVLDTESASGDHAVVTCSATIP